MGINAAFSSWLRGAQSAATTTLRAAQNYGATLQQQTMTALSAAQQAVTRPFQQQTRSAQPSTANPYTTTTKTGAPASVFYGRGYSSPTQKPSPTVQPRPSAFESATRATVRSVSPVSRSPTPAVERVQALRSAISPAARSAAPSAFAAATRATSRAVTSSAPPAAQGAPASVFFGRGYTSPATSSSRPPASQASSNRGLSGVVAAAPGIVRQAAVRAIQSTPMGIPIAAARAAPGVVSAGRDILGYSSSVDRYKNKEAAFQKGYAAQKPLYDQYVKNVQSYEKSRAAYDKLSQQYDQRVAAYQANPTKTGLAEIRMLEANLQMLGTPLQARYEQIRAQDRALTPLWQQAEATEAARKGAETVQGRNYGVVSSAVIDALGAARMGTTPPASRRPSVNSEQALLYGAYPAAVGAADWWRSNVSEPFERGVTNLTGGRPLVVPQGAIDAVRHPVARGAITALAPGMASIPLAMDLVTGAKQWAGAEPGINVTRFATGVVRSPADAAEIVGMAVPGVEMAARRVMERPSDLLYLPVAGMAYMGAGTVEAFKLDPEGTAGSLAGMALLSRGVGRVSSAPVGRAAKAVRPRIVEARIASKIGPTDRPAFHAVSTIGRGIEGIRSDVMRDPNFGQVLNVGPERGPLLTNILADTPHSIYGSATRTGQMRPGTVMRQAKDVDVFTPDIDVLNLRIAREFGRPYSVEGSTVVRQVPGQGTVHAIDTHAIPEGYPLPGAGRGMRIQYEDAKVAPELPFEWMPKDLLRAGRITQEHLATQVQRKAASVAGEPVEGGWRFGPPEHRAGKDVFDLISDAEYLIGVEEARLPGMNPVRRALVSRRLLRLRKAVEELKKSPTLAKSYRSELERAKKSLEEVAAPEGDILLRVSSMPAPRRSPNFAAPSPLVFPAGYSVLNLPRSPSPVRGSPGTSGVRSPAPGRSPTRGSPRPSRSPSVLAGSISPIIAGGGASPMLGGASPSVVSSPSTKRSPAKRSPAPGTGRGSSSPGSPAPIVPSPYLYEPGPRTTIPSPSPLVWPAPQRPPTPQERRSRRKREDEEARRRRRTPGELDHWELGPAPGLDEMGMLVFGPRPARQRGSYLDFGPPAIGVTGLPPVKPPAHAGGNRKKRGKAAKKKK